MIFQKSLLIAVMVAWSAFPVSAFSQQHNPPQKSGLNGGATIQRQRIDRAIDTAMLMTVEEASQSLNKHNESYQLAHLSTLTPASPGRCFMNSMRGDRRIYKIFEHLLSLPPKEADKQAQSLFDNQFPIFVDEWRRGVRQRGFPKTGPLHHSLSAGLFFCSYFCSKDDLDSRIQKWNETLRQPEFEQSEGGKLFAPSRVIDPMFHLNLLVISAYRHQKSIAELNRDLETVCKKITGDEEPFLQATQMSFYKSYAETTDTDFTHIARGAPASDTQLLIEIPGFVSPDASLSLRLSDRWDQCLATVQAWRDRWTVL